MPNPTGIVKTYCHNNVCGFTLVRGVGGSILSHGAVVADIEIEKVQGNYATSNPSRVVSTPKSKNFDAKLQNFFEIAKGKAKF